MRLSSRLSDDLEPNDFFRALEKHRAQALPLLDLTISNPTLAGLEYPQEDIKTALAEAAGHSYQPDPKGLPAARSAVAEYYQDHGCGPPSESIVLTSGTSEAYAFLFKLLCDPGEAILFPKPSYPLVELIADLEGVAARPYPLAGKDRRWHVADLFENLTPDARAVVAVSPNNPTGSMLTGKELREVSGFCASRQLALIVDEVFLDYPSPNREGDVVSTVGNPDALTFTLGGLSKSCGLPQMKLSWITVSGPQPEARQALSRLEFIADAFLSVGTPVQQAAPVLLALGKQVREQIRRRIDANDALLREILREYPEAPIAPREGGWYAVINLPAGSDDEEFALSLLENRSTLVQPGFLYDYDDPVIVVSLITPEAEFREGAQRIRGCLRTSRK
ncbi:MAG TPA: pyridoxal phosphate-dependent aminotransferase [Anaerolineales bacterium]